MGLKYYSEWPRIIPLAKLRGLDADNIILLLALREAEDGEQGKEFNRLDSMAPNLDGQTRAAINFIMQRRQEYQKYIVRVNPNDEYFDFIEYISDSDDKATKIREALTDVEKEFNTFKESI